MSKLQAWDGQGPRLFTTISVLTSAIVVHLVKVGYATDLEYNRWGASGSGRIGRSGISWVMFGSY